MLALPRRPPRGLRRAEREVPLLELVPGDVGEDGRDGCSPSLLERLTGASSLDQERDQLCGRRHMTYSMPTDTDTRDWSAIGPPGGP